MVRPQSSSCFCAGRTSFCCCCSVRTGASVIGWFNFVTTSLYVGLVVFSLHRVIDEVSRGITKLEEATTSTRLQTHTLTNDADIGSGEPLPSITTIVQLTADCTIGEGVTTSDQCFCEQNLNFKSVGPNVCKGEIRNCQICVLAYVEEYVVPTMYKSLAIPGALLVFSIIWLTAVESRSLRYVRLCGFTYIAVIFLQTILQLCFLGFGNQKLVHHGFEPLSWSVWLVFSLYAALNVYFIPTLYKYINLRKKEHMQGMEQGLLTSEIRAPAPGRAMEDTVDAFAIDSEGEMDVFSFAANEQSKPSTYGSNAPTQGEMINTRDAPI